MFFASVHTDIEEKSDFSEGLFLVLDIHLCNYILEASFFPFVCQLHTNNC